MHHSDGAHPFQTGHAVNCSVRVEKLGAYYDDAISHGAHGRQKIGARVNYESEQEWSSKMIPM